MSNDGSPQPPPAPSRRLYDQPGSSELRIGLAMSGGIALTLYESGVSHELYRFFAAWEEYLKNRDDPQSLNGYAKAFYQVPLRPVVDILTGASAGGINSVFLASCLATGQDFSGFHDLWIEKSGMEKLRYALRPESLLNPKALGDAMTEALHQCVDKHRKQAAHPPDLVVRLCRTHQYSRCLYTHDALGHKIDVQTRANVIGFETPHFIPEPEQEKDQIQVLTAAALATSAFPGAFPAVQDEGRWYVDGGLWNNQPIDLAVEVVRDKPAFLRTHRCILFVEPNPSNIPIPDPSAPTKEEVKPGFLSTLSVVPFLNVKGSIWPAVQDILDHNQRYSLYYNVLQNDGLEEFAESFGQQQITDSERQIRAAAEFQPDGPESIWRVDPSTERRSLDFPIPLNHTRIDEILFDRDPALIQAREALMVLLGYKRDRPGDTTPLAFLAFWAGLKGLAVIGAYDLERRVLRRQIEILNNILASGSEPTPQLAARKAVLYARIEQLNLYLHQDSSAVAAHWNSERENGSSSQSFRMGSLFHQSRFRPATETMLQRLNEAARGEVIDQDEALSALTGWTREVEGLAEEGRLKVNAYVSGMPVEAAIAQREEMGRFLAPLEETAFGPDSPFKSIQLFHQQWAYDQDRNLRTISDGDDPEALLREAFRAEPVEARSHDASSTGTRAMHEQINLKQFTDSCLDQGADLSCIDPVDITRHIFAGFSDLSGKKPIDLVRISPNDTYNEHLIPRRGSEETTPAVRKLAGEGLGHFSGFLDQRWRRNDYIWGRLDACEILLRTLQTYGLRENCPLTEDEYESLLSDLQTDILRNEGGLLPGRKKIPPHLFQPIQRPVIPNSFTAAERKQQEVNARLIGYGYQTPKNLLFRFTLSTNLIYTLKTLGILTAGGVGRWGISRLKGLASRFKR